MNEIMRHDILVTLSLLIPPTILLDHPRLGRHETNAYPGVLSTIYAFGCPAHCARVSAVQARIKKGRILWHKARVEDIVRVS